LGAEYLSATDAMQHILDLVAALGKVEAAKGDGEKIVWRVKDAHTNSPPLTMLLVATALEPSVSVALEANRVVSEYQAAWDDLLIHGERPEWFDAPTAGLYKRILERSTGPIGQTVIVCSDQPAPITIIPRRAERALIALERADLADAEGEITLERSEYGAREGHVAGLITLYGKPALAMVDRITGERVAVTLTDELASRLGSEHSWSEAWEGRRVLVSGHLHYDKRGLVKKVEAEEADIIAPAPVKLADLEGIDLLEGRSVREHLAMTWGDDGEG
tara:strand:- start:928 stop:1755 length:828 start_codon:yes stop_codon:yes gene_type:complete